VRAVVFVRCFMVRVRERANRLNERQVKRGGGESQAWWRLREGVQTGTAEKVVPAAGIEYRLTQPGDGTARVAPAAQAQTSPG